MKTCNTIQKLFAATLLMSCIGSVMANESATLTVTGTLEPGACKVSFDGIDNAQVNFGNISVETAEGLERAVELGVACSSRMPVQLSVVDNVDRELGNDSPERFGVRANGRYVGGYYLTMGEVLSTDGQYLQLATVDSPDSNVEHLSHLESYTLKGDQGPVSISGITVPLKVLLDLERDAFDGVKEKVTLEGSATINLSYL